MTKKAATEKPAVEKKVMGLSLEALDLRIMEITIVGDTPLLVKRFSEKVMQDIRGGHEGTAPTQKPRRDAEFVQKEFEDAKYRTKDGKDGIPASAVKNAIISAAAMTNKSVSKTKVMRSLFVIGDILPIRGSEAVLATHPGKLQKGMQKVGILINRPCYEKWAVDLTIRYNAAEINPTMIANLLNLAGFGVGLHEWRPERKGTFGMFHVEKAKDREEKRTEVKHRATVKAVA